MNRADSEGTELSSTMVGKRKWEMRNAGFGVILSLIALWMWFSAQEKIKHPERFVHEYMEQHMRDLPQSAKQRIRAEMDYRHQAYSDPEMDAFQAKRIKRNGKIFAAVSIAVGLGGVLCLLPLPAKHPIA